MKTARWLVIVMILVAVAGCDLGGEDWPPLETVVIDTYEIPLDALAGAYAHDDPPQDQPPLSRTATFRIPDEIQDYRQLRLVASGTWNPGRVIRTYHVGNGYTFYDTISVATYFDLSLRTTTDPERCLEAAGLALGGEFTADDLVTECGVGGVVEAAYLLGRDIEATLTCNLALDDEDQILEPAAGEVTEIRLEAIDTSILQESNGMGWPYTIRPDP